MPTGADEAIGPSGPVASPRSGVTVQGLALVAVGAGTGAVARYGVELLFPGWPALWLVNLIGSALLGVLVGATARSAGKGRRLNPLLGTGLLGGFTTFSTAAVAATTPAGFAYLVVMTLGCAVCAAAGWWLGMRSR
ncbi:CrcB family protein [Enemella sp. A6]|uniref:CrcB family protein n=1 Tax=Enemella sp. A6 TaxID=3440152 RepID=UPI003EB8C9CD